MNDLGANTTANQDSWDDHWSQFGAVAEIGPTPRYRRDLIFWLLDVQSPGAEIRFLDIGSGTGEFAEAFLNRYPKASYLGLELSQTGVEVSRRRVPKAAFAQRDLLQPDPDDDLASFAATHVLCSEVLEHLDNPNQLLNNALRYCSKNCQFIVTVPGGPLNAFYLHIGHRRHYSPVQLAELLRRSRLQVLDSFGAGFPFFNIFRLLIAARGTKFVSDASRPPSRLTHLLSTVFGHLFALSSKRLGWQTIAIAQLQENN